MGATVSDPKTKCTVYLSEAHRELAELLADDAVPDPNSKSSLNAGMRCALALCSFLRPMLGDQMFRRLLWGVQGNDPELARRTLAEVVADVLPGPMCGPDAVPVPPQCGTGTDESPYIYTRAGDPTLPSIHSTHDHAEGDSAGARTIHNADDVVSSAGGGVGSDDPSEEIPEHDRATPDALIELWNQTVEQTRARFLRRNEDLPKGQHYWVLPKPATPCKKSRQRLARAIERMPRLSAWKQSIELYADLHPRAINGGRLGDLDRLCGRPKSCNENELYADLPIEERPLFIERLIDYVTWGAEPLPESRARKTAYQGRTPDESAVLEAAAKLEELASSNSRTNSSEAESEELCRDAEQEASENEAHRILEAETDGDPCRNSAPQLANTDAPPLMKALHNLKDKRLASRLQRIIAVDTHSSPTYPSDVAPSSTPRASDSKGEKWSLPKKNSSSEAMPDPATSSPTSVSGPAIIHTRDPEVA